LEAERIWSAVSADHLFPDAVAYRAFLLEHPWALRTTERGEAALLGRWKSHLDVLAIRGVWAAERAVPAFVADAYEVAAARGLARVMSPLLPEVLLGGYRAAGMRVAQRIVAIQGHPELVLPADPPLGVELRDGSPVDLPAVARVDAASFDDFWSWRESDLATFLHDEHLAVAEARGGALIGYTLTTVSRGSATLTRLATAPQARRSGVGRSLLAASAAWAVRQGAVTFALCTQEENSASRGLYASAGLSEIDERYAFALGDVGREGRL
jgi:ribosomal-protein-alanine N-acetyltransferase